MKIAPSLVFVDLLRPYACIPGDLPVRWIGSFSRTAGSLILPVLSRMCLNEFSLDRIC